MKKILSILVIVLLVMTLGACTLFGGNVNNNNNEGGSITPPPLPSGFEGSFPETINITSASRTKSGNALNWPGTFTRNTNNSIWPWVQNHDDFTLRLTTHDTDFRYFITRIRLNYVSEFSIGDQVFRRRGNATFVEANDINIQVWTTLVFRVYHNHYLPNPNNTGILSMDWEATSFNQEETINITWPNNGRRYTVSNVRIYNANQATLTNYGLSTITRTNNSQVNTDFVRFTDTFTSGIGTVRFVVDRSNMIDSRFNLIVRFNWQEVG